MLTPPKTVHLSGPLHQPRNLLYRYGQTADPPPQSLGSIVYLWREASPDEAQALNSACSGCGFFGRCGSRILRCLVGRRWRRCADICA
jgi:hypothetical protein